MVGKMRANLPQTSPATGSTATRQAQPDYQQRALPPGDSIVQGGRGTDSVFQKGQKVLENFDTNNAYVKPKHLSTTKGNGAKFLGNSKLEAESILKDSMKNGTIQSVVDNGLTSQGMQSLEIVIDAGKAVGTKGETLIKIILSEDGGMLSAYPIK